jgi:hypothetical protein
MKAMIEEIKDILKTFAELVRAAGLAAEDGKFGWSDFPFLVPALISLPKAIAGANRIKFSEITDENKKELQRYLVDELDMPQEKTEEFIERTFQVLSDISLLIRDYYQFLKDK